MSSAFSSWLFLDAPHDLHKLFLLVHLTRHLFVLDEPLQTVNFDPFMADVAVLELPAAYCRIWARSR